MFSIPGSNSLLVASTSSSHGAVQIGRAQSTQGREGREVEGREGQNSQITAFQVVLAYKTATVRYRLSQCSTNAKGTVDPGRGGEGANSCMLWYAWNRMAGGSYTLRKFER